MTRLTAVILALLCLVASCQVTGSGLPAPDILIASDLPVSGELAPDWLPAAQAIQLAVSRHPTIGRFSLAYFPLDDAVAGFAEPAKGVQNVRRMIDDGRVLGMIGPANSTYALDEIPVANEASLGMLSPANTNWCLTRTNPLCNPQPDGLRPSGTNNYFRIVAPDSFQGRAMARYARQTLKLARIAAFTLQGKFEDLTLSGFTAEFRRDGGDLVLSTQLPSDTTDFRPFLREARAQGAQAVYAATEDDVCQVRTQMNGIFPDTAQLLGMDNFVESSACIRAAGANADRLVAIVSVLDTAGTEDPSLRAVVSAYKSAYPRGPAITPYTFIAYDCALVLIQAITEAVRDNGDRLPTRLQVVQAIAHSQFKGLTRNYAFDAYGDAVSPLMALYQVTGGQWVHMGQIDDSPTPD